jgi:hypothetical protein
MINEKTIVGRIRVALGALLIHWGMRLSGWRLS